MDLRERRKKKGYTLSEVHEMSGVSIMYLSELERGEKKNPSAKKLSKIAKALDMPYEELSKQFDI